MSKPSSCERLDKVSNSQFYNSTQKKIQRNSDYQNTLAETGIKFQQQNGPKGTYEMNSDNQISLWNMIEQFKGVKEDSKEMQIAEKTANAAVQFRNVNQAQKAFDERLRCKATKKEQQTDKTQLAKDMLKFNQDMIE